MNVALYLRVSTTIQNLEVQTQELKKFCDFRNYNVVSVYEDKMSGKDMNRPGFTKLLTDLETNPLDINAVVILKLDRIGRSVKDLIYISGYLQKHNVGLIAVHNNIDTTTREGRLFFHIMSSFAEYERELITERTQLGRDYAKEKGVRFGRPIKKLPIDEIKRDLALGIPKAKIAKKLKISRTTLYNALKDV